MGEQRGEDGDGDGHGHGHGSSRFSAVPPILQVGKVSDGGWCLGGGGGGGGSAYIVSVSSVLWVVGLLFILKCFVACVRLCMLVDVVTGCCPCVLFVFLCFCLFWYPCVLYAVFNVVFFGPRGSVLGKGLPNVMPQTVRLTTPSAVINGTSLLPYIRVASRPPCGTSTTRSPPPQRFPSLVSSQTCLLFCTRHNARVLLSLSSPPRPRPHVTCFAPLCEEIWS